MKRFRHTARAPHLWHMRRAWASLGITGVLMGMTLGTLAVISLKHSWMSEGALEGFWVSSTPPSVPVPIAQPLELPPVEMSAPSIPAIAPLPVAPAEAVPVALPKLSPAFDSLLEFPVEELAETPPVAKTRPSRPVGKPARAAGAKAVAAQPPAAEAQGEYTPPAYRSAPLPPYPAAMRQSRVQGSVRLRIFLDDRGRPERVEVAESSGHTEFDTTARSWVQRHWVFSPARRGGKPVPGTVITRVQFVLQ